MKIQRPKQTFQCQKPRQLHRLLGILACLALAIFSVRNLHNPESTNSTSSSSTSNFAWVQRYQDEFPFSMQPSPGCNEFLNDKRILRELAHTAVDTWLSHNQQRHSQPLPAQAEEAWRRAMEACHGPYLPSLTVESQAAVAHNYTLQAFWDGFLRCVDFTKGGHPSLFSGEWCMEGWSNRAKTALIEASEDASLWQKLTRATRMTDPREDAFITMARCALKMEFPLYPNKVYLSSSSSSTGVANTHSTTIITSSASSQSSISNNLTTRQRRPGWKPKRTILLTPTLGPKGGVMGCKLVATAYPRGWDVVLIEGQYKGVRFKYTDTLTALKIAVDQSDIPAEDTLVILADSMDVLVNRSPEYVVESFLGMNTDFSFSAEGACFPLASWPHSIGMAHHVCDDLFPTSTHPKPIFKGPKFANTGGWIGIASAAFVVLKELSSLILQEGPDQPCFHHGTDQLLGNVAHLRHSQLVGLDANYTVFVSGGWGLLHRKELTPQPIQKSEGSTEGDADNVAFCGGGQAASEPGDVSTLQCPALLHFNGFASEGGALETTYQDLISDVTLKTCRKGRVWVAHTGQQTMWLEDFEHAKRWEECRVNMTCGIGDQ